MPNTREKLTANKLCTLNLEARPLPAECTTLLETNSQLIKCLISVKEEAEVSKDTLLRLQELRTKLDSAFALAGPHWEGAVDKIWCFGPKYTGPNVLMNAVQGYDRPSLWHHLTTTTKQPLRKYDNSIVSGFQLATLAGPLCEEPMHGMCFVLKEWEHRSPSAEQPVTGPSNPKNPEVPRTVDSYGPLSGQLISAMKEGCRRSFLAQPARLMAAMYSSNILATVDVLGKVYGVLGRRNGRVLSDEMREGSVMFNIHALVPVAESFGFAEEIRKRTSGLANPQLIFSHWEVQLSVAVMMVNCCVVSTGDSI